MPTPTDVFNDPKFQALSPADKLAVLQRIDPDFAKLSPQDQQQVVNFNAGRSAAPVGRSQSTAGPPQPASQVADVSTAGGVMREFAGGAGETLNPINIVRGLAQAAREQAPTDDWSLKGGLTNIGKAIEGPAGMIINPLARSIGTAGKWYWDAARGKIPYAYEQWLSAAPEALGQGAAQAALLRTPINRMRGVAPESTGVFGVLTRAKNAMNRLEQNYGNELVDATEIEKAANRVKAMEQFGTTTPKPIDALLNKLQGRPHPYLTFQEARTFENIIGNKAINWDELAGGKVNGLMKQVDGAISDANTNMLKPRGAADAYVQSKADFTRGYWWLAKSRPVGGTVGGLAGHVVGYPLGEVLLGHPWYGGAAGGAIGTGVGTALGPGVVRSIVEPGAFMRGTGAGLEAAGQAARVGGAAQGFTPQQERDARDAIRQLVQERLHPPGGAQ